MSSTLMSSPPMTSSYKPGGGDDDVGLEFAAVLQPEARVREAVDLAGDDGSALVPDRLKGRRRAPGTAAGPTDCSAA